jgi:hypothetical protein
VTEPQGQLKLVLDSEFEAIEDVWNIEQWTLLGCETYSQGNASKSEE